MSDPKPKPKPNPEIIVTYGPNNQKIVMRIYRGGKSSLRPPRKEPPQDKPASE